MISGDLLSLANKPGLAPCGHVAHSHGMMMAISLIMETTAHMGQGWRQSRPVTGRHCPDATDSRIVGSSGILYWRPADGRASL